MEFFVLVAAVLVLAPGIRVLSQPGTGFLSIDCGLEGSSYTEANGIEYVPDGPYVDSGEILSVGPGNQQQNLERRYKTLRSFPSASGDRSCYVLPAVAGDKYLLRMETYDGRNRAPGTVEFDLYLGPDFWYTVRVGERFVYEAVFVAWASWVPACLVNTGVGTPFVSAVELRPLSAALYPSVTPALSMALYDRRNMGATSFTGFSADPYDRFWWTMDQLADSRWTNLSTGLNIQPDPSFAEPLPVLQTAVEAPANDTVLTAMTWTDSGTFSFMAFLHFADFQNAKLRQFDIYFNGDQLGQRSYSPSYLVASCVYNSAPITAADGKYNATLVSTAKSVLPPMINAIEIYRLIPRDGRTTFSKDIDAIMAIKSEYGVKKNWMGDPCFPTKYAWNGIKCSNTSVNTTRITSLDLSHSNLNGTVSTKFMLLTALENLDLSHNNLSGSIPDSLPSLPSLRVLNLSGNHLNGNSLCKSYTGSLVLRYDSDENVCNQIKSSRKRIVVLITSVAVSVFVMAALFLVYFTWQAKRKPIVSIGGHARNVQIENVPRSKKDQGDHLQDTENRRFTYKDLEKFTNNFKQFIGKGGFGLVYYGCLEDGTEVAVKLRSESSSHGLDEFLAEVQSLTKVHHRNLVSLVGYCWERDHLALVYEYMSQGNLNDHLRGKNGGAAETLTWGTRLRVVLEAAQGLDYLHKGCSPPIIHRDVKSSNILLGQNLQAKIADLGLSRTYLSDAQTHISATAAGTPGFMDPEYYLTGRLTESSDVYSFGVVLLEAITGEPPMVPGHGHIIQRVKQRIAMGDIHLVADRQLGGAYDVTSMWKVVDTALMCTADAGAGRPTMADVVAHLKDSLALEEARKSEYSNPTSLAASENAALISPFGPSAR